MTSGILNSGSAYRTPMYRMSKKLVRFQNAGRVVLALFAGFSILLGGCGQVPELDLGPEDSAKTDTVATLLTGVDEDAFRAAFSAMGDYAYTRYTRTEQFDSDDFLVAFREYVSRTSQESGVRTVQISEADSAGAFDFGFFDRFTSSNLPGLNPVDLIPFLLPDDPAYLRGRNRDKYEWSYLPDTLLWDTQAQVIEVKARALHGDGENIRRVRHYVDRTTNELIAMYLERVDLALLFREESQFYVHMRRAGDGRLVPHNTRFHTHIKTPFNTDSKFRTVSTYYEVERIVAGGTSALTESASTEDSPGAGG